MNEGRTQFSAWLNHRRKALDLTQYDLARRIGCSESTIKKLEEGTRKPSKQIAELLAECLAIPASEHVAFVKFARSESDNGAFGFAQTGDITLPYAGIGGYTGVTGFIGQPPGFLAHVRHPNNLPSPPNTFIGREREVAAACALLRRPGVRLLSLIGPPGIGKTRLSLQIAAEMFNDFENGVFFVPLAPVSDHRMVASAIAQALDVRETARRSLLDSLKNYLRSKRLLLVLDNFEQVASAGPIVGDLLSAAPGLKVLITSRAVLALYGEHELKVPPMTLPDRKRLPSIERLAHYESVALFIDRSLAVRPDMVLSDDNAQAITDICYKLDGLPLAIELAAARTKLLSLQNMLARLEEIDGRLRHLTGGPRNLPARQRTLRGAIAWSYDLLDADAQKLFRLMSVFVGGCTLEAAHSILDFGFWILDSGINQAEAEQSKIQNPKLALEQSEGSKIEHVLDSLAFLADSSLLRQDEAVDGEIRFSMLETIREYGLERLDENGEAEAVQQWHANYYLGLAERAEPELRGPQQATWLERLEVEHGNLRAALVTFEKRGDWEGALRLSGALGWFWFRRGHLSEGRERLLSALSRSGSIEPAHVAQGKLREARAKALLAIARLAEHQGDNVSARSGYEDSREISQQLGDVRGVSHALAGLAFVYYREGNRSRAQELYEQSLAGFREIGDKLGIAISIRGLGDVALQESDHATARRLYAQSLALFQELEDKYSVATLYNGLGNVTLDQGDYATAHSLYEDGLVIFRELGYKYGVAGSLMSLAEASRCQENYVEAVALNEESLEIWRELGEKWNMAMTLHNLGHSVHHMEVLGGAKDKRAERIFTESLSLFNEVGAKVGIPMCLAGLAGVAATQGQAERAAILLGATERLLTAMGVQLQAADLADYKQNVAIVSARLDEATFSAAWNRGRLMPLEEALTYGIED